MPETTALGAAMAAGLADGIAVWNLDSTLNCTDPSTDVFTASIPESSTSHDCFESLFVYVFRFEEYSTCNGNLSFLKLKF